jgi:hypothetical protein
MNIYEWWEAINPVDATVLAHFRVQAFPYVETTVESCVTN